MIYEALALGLLLLGGFSIWWGAKRADRDPIKAAFIGGGCLLLVAAAVPAAILILSVTAF